MTSEDDKSLEEEEIDEIVDRVVDRLQDAGVGDGDGPTDGTGDATDGDPGDRSAGEPTDRREGARREAERRKRRAERVRDRTKRAKDRARREAEGHADPPDPPRMPGIGGEDWDPDGDGWEAFGRRMEEFGEELGRSIERSIEEMDLEGIDRTAERAAVSGLAGLNVTPDEHTRTAIYKTQLQKGGRIAVPDAEIEALGIGPGDTLQVVLFPIHRDRGDGD